MLTKYHVLIGLIFSLLIWMSSPSIGFFGMSLIFLSSFLIDVDHYLLYIFIQKDFNFKKAYYWCKNLGLKYLNLPKEKIQKIYVPLCWFHGIEFLIPLIILSYFFNSILFILTGCLIHITSDNLRYLYLAIKYPSSHYWNHPIVPTYKFIKTINYPTIVDI